MKKQRHQIRRAKTPEEADVEFAILFGFISGLALWAAISILTPIYNFAIGRGYVFALSFSIFLVVACDIPCNFLWGLYFRFSRDQAVLMVKYVSALSTVMAAFVGYNYVVYIAVAPMVPDPNSPVILIVGLANFVFIGLVGLTNKLLTGRTKEWFRIKYVSEKASLEHANKSLEKAREAMEKNDYDTASKAFHSAAITHMTHNMWREASEDYALSANSLAKANKEAFRVSTAWLYLLSSLASILNHENDNAMSTIDLSEKTISAETIETKVRERILLLLDLLKAVTEKDTESSVNEWERLRRKMGRWGYPAMEETLIMLEKIPGLDSES